MGHDIVKQLRDLLVGSKVLAIEYAGKDEHIAKFVIERDGKKTEFDLCATELGAWIADEKEMCSNGRYLISDATEALGEMYHHAKYLCFESDCGEEGLPGLFELLDDPTALALGFRCTRTGKEWWFSIASAKACPWASSLSTPESRRKLVDHLSSLDWHMPSQD